MTDSSDIFPNISGYKIERKLGEGGMASVYLAVQEGFERLVALKVLAPHLGKEDEDYKQRFVREARTAAKMSHQCIVPIYDFGICNDYHYIAMEYLPGGDLKQRMLKGIALNEAISITKAIAKGLDYASQKGLVHRDIKPENILFREDNSPVISDFGIARQIYADTNTSMVSNLVGKNIVGTPRYMSPEQAHGGDVDARSDLYSLGTIFYELLTGKAPFISDSATSVGIKHMTEMPPPLPPELASLQAIVDIAMEKNPDNRFQTGNDFVKALVMVEDRLSSSHRNTLILNTSDTIISSSRAITQPSTVNISVQQTIPSQTLQSRLSPSQAETYYKKPWFWLACFVASQLALGGIWFTFQSKDQESNNLELQDNDPSVTTTGTATSTDSATAAAQNEPDPSTIAPPQTAIDGANEAQLITEPQNDQQQTEVNLLLSNANAAIQQGRWTKPETDSALYYFRQVLTLVPDHPDAIIGMDKLNQHFLTKIKQSLAAKEFDKAESLLNSYANIAPPGELASLTKRLNEGKAAFAKTQAAKAKLEALLADINRVKSQNRDPQTNALLRDRYLAILANDPTNTMARQGLKDVAQFEAQMAEQAIAEHRIKESEQHLLVLRNTAPDFELSSLQSKLEQARANAEKISVQLNQASVLIDQPYIKPGWLESNQEARDRLTQAYALIDDARKINRKDWRIDVVLTRLDEKYAAIVASLLQDKNKSAANEFVSDTRQFDWRGAKLALANSGIAGTTVDRGSDDQTAVQLAVSALLTEAQQLIDTPYIKPGLLESNREPRARLTLAYQKIDDARKLAPDNQRVTDLLVQLDTKYAAIVQLLIDDGEQQEARAFVDDTRNFKWQNPTLAAVNIGK